MGRQDIDILISGGSLLTASGQGVIKGGAVAIKANRIVDVGNRSKIERKYRAEKRIDASGKIVMPGLIDGHMHSAQIMLRGSFDDELTALPPIWLNFLIPYEKDLSNRQVETASRLSSLNLIKSGTTCFVEAGGPRPHSIAEASLKAGLRAMISKSTIDMDPGIPMYQRTDEIVAEYRKLIKKWHGRDNGRLKVWISLRQVMLNTIELYEKLFALADKHDTRITMHLAEDRVEVDYCLEKFGKRPVELMHDRGFLNERVLAAHMVFVNDEEARMLERAGVSICWCPYVDAYVMGPSRVNDLLARGINVVFGSDGGAWDNLDLFEQARHGRVSAKIISNSMYHDKTGLKSSDTIKMLTSFGGKALGEPIGELRKGYKADIIVLGFDENLVPGYDMEYAVVNMASSKNVETVIVDGKIVMENRNLVTIDESKVIEDAKELALNLEDRLKELRNSVFPANGDGPKGSL